MRFLILSACLLVAACSHSSTPIKRVLAPANSSSRVDDLDAPKDGENAVAYMRYIQDEYYTCALKHDALRSTDGQ